LGADSAAYRVSAHEGGFRATSPGQHLSTSFAPAGVSVHSGSTRLGLSLRAVGYGASLRSLGEVAPSVKANRVLYARAGLSEWYANGPLGLEQGFTIPRAPSGHPAGALTLSMALSGNAHAALGAGGQSVSLSRRGAPVLRYSGLSATDASGRVLHSWLSLQAGRLLLRVDAAGARYPLRIDPFFQQGTKLVGAGETGKGLFGFSVALSPDGNTALIGGPGDNKETGAAWVFTRKEGKWTEQAKLTGASEVGAADFGFSVALGTKEGNTAIIGGPFDNSEVGAAWVFTRSGTTWTQQTKLTGGAEVGKGLFGTAVALASTEGNTAVVGGREDNTKLGAAWVFTRSGTTWSEQTKLTGGGESAGGKLGVSAALSADGNIALIGGPGNNAFLGAAWVFTRSGTVWAEQAKLTGSAEISAPEFGAGVALSGEGNTALIGGPGNNILTGAAWVFTRSGTTWTQQGGKLTPSDENGKGQFGAAVALSEAGNTGMIGGPEDNTEKRVGAAWFFDRPGTTWFQQGTKRTGTEGTPPSEFANSVALSSDGNTALSGGSADGSEVGAAWVFLFQAPSPPAVVTGAASSINQSQATLNGTVNPNGGEVSECKFEFGTTTAYGSSVPCSPSSLGQGESLVAASGAVVELTPNTEYDFRIVAKNVSGETKGSNATFKTLAPVGTAPTVVTSPASPVASASATLNATVNPNSGEVYECKFEWGTTTAYGKTAPCSPPPGSGSSPVAVSQAIAELAASTVYHFRIVAVNPGGTSRGNDETFTTLSAAAPAVVTAAASSIGQTLATLNATVNPKEQNVTPCTFEYGTTTSYGSSAPCSSLPGAGTSPVAVSAAVTGLTNKTIYHFRISATNAGGTALGGDRTFRATAPHLYKNGVLGAEAKKVRDIGWGTVKIKNATLGEVECHTIAAGFLENPTGGRSAVGQTQAFSYYECISTTCTTLGGKIEVAAEKLAWSAEATELEEGVLRIKTGNQTKTAGAAFLRVNCVGSSNILYTGENNPKFLGNGLSIGAFPTEEEFDAPGSGELESEGQGGSTLAGKQKTEGYAAQELIELKNP
jgi:hypothetical protein